MEKNFFYRAAKKISHNDISGAFKVLEEGVTTYAKHMEGMIEGIDRDEAGLILTVLRPLVAALENIPHAKEIEKIINGLFKPQLPSFSKPVTDTDEQEGEA